MNLAFNARDAMQEGGELEIRVRRVIVEEGQPSPLPVLTTGPWLQLVVADTGHGIAPEHLAHVFEPFFTTKPPGVGTGLGLAQVFGIVKQHDGYIDIATTLDEGTAFNIFLPLIDVGQQEDHPAPEPVLDDLPRQAATILVVEDDDATREATRDTLASLSYRVLTADNGHNALALLADSATDIDLVLSDMVMPGMGGRALFEEVRTRYPHIPVVLATGYPLDAEGQALLEQGVVAWLSKPFGVQKLALTLRNALTVAAAQTQDPL
jgi:CheY-like chemotaxis protein